MLVYSYLAYSSTSYISLRNGFFKTKNKLVCSNLFVQLFTSNKQLFICVMLVEWFVAVASCAKAEVRFFGEQVLLDGVRVRGGGGKVTFQYRLFQDANTGNPAICRNLSLSPDLRELLHSIIWLTVCRQRSRLFIQRVTITERDIKVAYWTNALQQAVYVLCCNFSASSPNLT